MAEFSSEFLTYLKSRSAITSLVGSSTGARIYYERPKQAVSLPYVVLTQTAGETFTHLGGRAAIQSATFDVVSVGATRQQADELSSAIYGELTPNDKTMGSTYVTEVETQLHRDGGDDLPQDGSDSVRYWSRSAYKMFFVT